MNYFERARKFKAKKRLGQNFLVDGTAIDRIIEAAKISSEDIIMEIGPGLGFVTEKAAKLAKKVVAVELDTDAIKELNKLNIENLEIIEGDILKTDVSQISKDHAQKLKVIANIPYYITTPILVHLLGEIDEYNHKNRECIEEIILMVQYEVAKRITANRDNKSKEYGSISVLSNFWADTEIITKVGARSFYPAPKVDSAVVRLKIRQTPSVNTNNAKLLRRIVHACFNARRKTIKNALGLKGFSQELITKALKQTGIDASRRGETLTLEEFALLADNMDKLTANEKD
ncbi:MAG: 16S rRNA (adenine(1518)-N(6)/adenine(1519)-N(6))-dimethyltransferase RsmA [bacterium]